MNQNCTDERNKLLLVMAGHDLKLILGSVSVLLAGYLQEAGKYVTASEVQHFAARVGNLQSASTEMAVFVDEMLSILDQGSVTVDPLKISTQYVYRDNLNSFQPISNVASKAESEMRLYSASQGEWLM